MKLNKVILQILSISCSVLVFVLVVVGLVNLGKFCYGFGYRVFTEQPMESGDGKKISVSIESGMSEYEVGEMLEEASLIRDKNLFFAQLKLSAYSGKLLPGTYKLNTSMTAKEMIKVMATEPPEDTEETDTSE